MLTPLLRPSSACCVWTAFIVIQSDHHVAAFAPSSSMRTSELSTVAHSSPCHRISRRLPRTNRPQHHQCNHQQEPPRKSTTLNLGVEDIIFSAQSAGSSLANTVLSSGSAATGSASSLESLKSLVILYTAGLWTSFSPCSLGLLPITVSYISNAAQERKDKNTVLPTLAFAAGLALVFTALGVSASALGGVFGSSSGGRGGDGGDPLASLLLAAISSLVSVLMGLQLLELIRIPLPSLDFKFRRALAFDNNGGANSGGGSLFDDGGGLVLDNLPSNQESTSVNGGGEDDGTTEDKNNEMAALIRTCLLGGTSALVASPCATPVLASLLAYLASASSDLSSSGDTWKGASLMLSYTLGYSTPLLAVGATGGQALVNMQKARGDNSGEGFNLGASLGQWITPLTGGVLITFGMNGFLVALLGDPSMSALAPIIE